MKHLKILGLLAVAAAAMMAFAANASATTVTGNGASYTGAIVASNEGGHVSLHNPAAKIECSSLVEGTSLTHGDTVTAEGAITKLEFTGCTGGWTVTANTNGTLIAHATSGGNGTLTSTGATVTAVNDIIGITCRYVTSATDVGTLTGSTTTGGTATLDISASIPFHSGSPFCGTAPSAWTGSYSVSTPMSLNLD